MQLESKIAVAMIVSHFHIALDHSKMPYKSVEEFSETCTAFVTLKPRDGMWLKLTPRVPPSSSPQA
jgi:predicted TIM-barrel fold metal-dependent hydrolase